MTPPDSAGAIPSRSTVRSSSSACSHQRRPGDETPARPAATGPAEYAGRGTSRDWRLYTPAEAAQILAIKESWLRRKAGTRTISCTFIGKHLRFSDNDLRSIATRGAHTPQPPRGRPRRR
jgi:hypothetical protein